MVMHSRIRIDSNKKKIIMSDDKNQLTINIDMKVSDRQYHVVENSVTSVLFQLTDTATRYVYNIHMREMKKQSETTAAGLGNLD